MKVFSAALLIAAITAIKIGEGPKDKGPPKGKGGDEGMEGPEDMPPMGPKDKGPPKGKGGDEGMEGPEDMPPMGPPPSCAERAFEGLWMATDADGNDNLDAAEFGAVVDYGCDEDPDCTPEDAEMAKGWFEEVTGGEPVPKDEVKDFLYTIGAEEFESENDSELCHMADEVEMYLDDACSGTDEPPASGNEEPPASGNDEPPAILAQIASKAKKWKPASARGSP